MKVFFIIALSLTTKIALACSCAQMSPSQLIRDDGGALILATANKSTVINSVGGQRMLTKLNVIRDYRNSGLIELDVTSSVPTGGNCGLSFDENAWRTAWLVKTYKNPMSGEMRISRCSISLLSTPELYETITELERLAGKNR